MSKNQNTKAIEAKKSSRRLRELMIKHGIRFNMLYLRPPLFSVFKSGVNESSGKLELEVPDLGELFPPHALRNMQVPVGHRGGLSVLTARGGFLKSPYTVVLRCDARDQFVRAIAWKKCLDHFLGYLADERSNSVVEESLAAAFFKDLFEDPQLGSEIA